MQPVRAPTSRLAARSLPHPHDAYSLRRAHRTLPGFYRCSQPSSRLNRTGCEGRSLRQPCFCCPRLRVITVVRHVLRLRRRPRQMRRCQQKCTTPPLDARTSPAPGAAARSGPYARTAPIPIHCVESFTSAPVANGFTSRILRPMMPVALKSKAIEAVDAATPCSDPGATCAYDAGAVCQCVGASTSQLVWACVTASARDDQCPVLIPNSGTTCTSSTDNAFCEYSVGGQLPSDGGLVGVFTQCDILGYWIWGS